MAQTPSIVSTYIDTIISLISGIEFDNENLGTLGSQALIFRYDKSSIDSKTEVRVYRDNLKSEVLDNVDNTRKHQLIISIVSNAEGREQEAQEDLYYLEEQIYTVLEKNMSNLQWFYLDNIDINSRPRAYNNNFFYKDIALQINEIVTTY
jgi:hypothetical protein